MFMKKYLLLAICFFVTAAGFSQDKYKVIVPSAEEKHSNALFQLYAFMGAGINFAKAQGVSPYEYGKYLGKLFAPTWNPANDFNAMVQGAMYHSELTRRASDPAMQVKENSDGSVTIVSDEKLWRRYFNDNNKMATMDEFLEFIKGVYEPIADRMGATARVELKNGSMVVTLTKK
jgi:hypothetical protein